MSQDLAPTPRRVSSEVDSPSSASSSSSRPRRPRSEAVGSASRLRARRHPLVGDSRRLARRQRRRAADSEPRSLGALGSPAARRLVARRLVPSQPRRRSAALDSPVRLPRLHLAQRQRSVGLEHRRRQDSGSNPRLARRRLAGPPADSGPRRPRRRSAVQVAALVNRRLSLLLDRRSRPRPGLGVGAAPLAVGQPVVLLGNRPAACRRDEVRAALHGERRKRSTRAALEPEPPCTSILSRACLSTCRRA